MNDELLFYYDDGDIPEGDDPTIAFQVVFEPLVGVCISVENGHGAYESMWLDGDEPRRLLEFLKRNLEPELENE